MNELRLNQLARTTLDCCFRVHTALGPGLLESSYKACLGCELVDAGLEVQIEVPVPLIYRGRQLAEVGYRVDVLVEDELIIEIKSVGTIIPIHKAQLLSYLRLSNKRLGLLINFNVAHLKLEGRYIKDCE
jgi:GxxExxY protein